MRDYNPPSAGAQESSSTGFSNPSASFPDAIVDSSRSVDVFKNTYHDAGHSGFLLSDLLRAKQSTPYQCSHSLLE